MQEVSGSIPLTSTKIRSPSSRGLGHNPFTVGTGVRIPLGTPQTSPILSHAVSDFLYLPVLSGNGCPIEFHRLPPNRSFLDGSIDGFSLE